MADHEKAHLFLIAKDGLHSDSESGDYDMDEIAREVTQGRESVARYCQPTEQYLHIGGHSINTRNHVKKVCASLLTTRSLTCIILFCFTAGTCALACIDNHLVYKAISLAGGAHKYGILCDEFCCNNR